MSFANVSISLNNGPIYLLTHLIPFVSPDLFSFISNSIRFQFTGFIFFYLAIICLYDSRLLYVRPILTPLFFLLYPQFLPEHPKQPLSFVAKVSPMDNKPSFTYDLALQESSNLNAIFLNRLISCVGIRRYSVKSNVGIIKVNAVATSRSRLHSSLTKITSMQMNSNGKVTQLPLFIHLKVSENFLEQLSNVIAQFVLL